MSTKTATLRRTVPIQPEELLDQLELADRLGVSHGYLRSARCRPDAYPTLATLPEPLRLVSSRPVWRAADVERWIRETGWDLRNGA